MALSARKCCLAPAPDGGVWHIVHWHGSTRRRFIVSAEQMRQEQQRSEFRLPLCGRSGDGPGDIVEDPREVTCEGCVAALAGKYVQWHNKLLAKAREAKP